MMRRRIGVLAVLVCASLTWVAAQQKNADWATYGLDYYEQRFSTLDQINDSNAAQLGLAWQFDTATDRGLEATPLVVDGVMYATGSWSVTYAVDARTGKQLWKYDPEVHRKYDNLACCDVVNRGAAFYKDKVYVGVLDGRLVAIEGAAEGQCLQHVAARVGRCERRYLLTRAVEIAGQQQRVDLGARQGRVLHRRRGEARSEEHTSELQSH